MATVDGKKTGGRQKGSENKVTRETKQFLQQLLHGESDNVREALEKVRMEDPGKYLDWIRQSWEYVIPKLARTELEAEITDTFEKKLIEQFSDEELIEFARSRFTKRS